MDPEMVVQLMIPKQLLSEDIVMTAQSCYNKNCLILEQIRLMDPNALLIFINILKDDISQTNVGNVLSNG